MEGTEKCVSCPASNPRAAGNYCIRMKGKVHMIILNISGVILDRSSVVSGSDQR